MTEGICRLRPGFRCPGVVAVLDASSFNTSKGALWFPHRQ